MTTLLMILGACMVGLGIGLMNPTLKDNPRKSKKRKNRRNSPWDDDPMYGTPLQKTDPPGWGTPHGY